MQPVHIPFHIPEHTATVAHAAFPNGTVIMRCADLLQGLYQEEAFATLYSTLGWPSQDPFRLLLVSLFQFLEGLSDRQAADAVRGRIDWKFGLGLDLIDPGFDYSVLSEFRQRLIVGQKEQLVFDALLDYLRTQGVLKARGRQRTDSTHVFGAIRQRNRLEFVIETVRHALNTLVVVAPDWIQAHVPAEWVIRYDQRSQDYHLPSSDQQRTRLAETVDQDGQQILTWIDEMVADQWLGQIPAIRTVCQVWEEQYTNPPEPLLWRDKRGMPAPTQQLISLYDLDARWANKGSRTWVGYKVFLTETCDSDQPRIITHVATTPANTADERQVDPIHADLTQADLLPAEHLMDAGLVQVEHVLKSPVQYGVYIVGPVARDSSWQAHVPDAFTKQQFHVDWERQMVTCPMGKKSHLWLTEQQGLARQVQVFFNRDDCLACSARSQCTRSKKGARILSLQPRHKHEALHDLRQLQHTATFTKEYAARSGVECLFSQGQRRCDLQHARYRGLPQTRLQQRFTATAINLLRYDAWQQGQPIAPTRHARFAALVAA